jgi:hypothetical protein
LLLCSSYLPLRVPNWAVIYTPSPLQRQQKKTREVYLAGEFRNVKQGDLSIGDYLNHQKATLAEVGAPVSDSDLVTNVIKGLDERFDSVTDIAPLLTLFPTFLNFRNMLLLQEMKVARRTANTSTSAFVAKGPAPPPLAGGLPPPNTGEGQQWRANPHHGGYSENKGKNKGYKSAADPPVPTLYNSWTRAIQMWPMLQPTSHGILGPRPGHRANAFMASPHAGHASA